jgi:hypothetical protein
MNTIALVLPLADLSMQELNATFATVPPRINYIVAVLNGPMPEISNLDRTSRVIPVVLKSQVGKAEALRRGFLYIAQNLTVDLVAQADARGKQSLLGLEPMIDQLKKGLDLVTANRYASQNLSQQPHRTAIRVFFSTIMNSCFNLNFEDYLCGTRVYTEELSKHFQSSSAFGYGLEIEQLIVASQMECKTATVGIESNLQNNFTEAEKIEDVMSVLLVRIPLKQPWIDLRQALSNCLFNVKRRVTFEIELPVERKPRFRFSHNRSPLNSQPSYASQSPDDVYCMTFLGY